MIAPFRLGVTAAAIRGASGSSGFDPYFENVSLLMHMDGSSGSETFTDSSSYAHTVSRTGTPTIYTADKKFGTGSLLLSGSGQYLTMPDHAAFDFGAGDFTIEAWINLSAVPTTSIYAGIFCQRASGGSNFGYALFLNGDDSGKVRFEWSTSGTSSAGGASSATAPALSTWAHVAVVRIGSSVTVYLNGVGGTPASIGSSTIFDSSNTPAIGVLSTNIDANYLYGLIDDLRVTKGVGRYAENFTPPSAPFPDSGPPVGGGGGGGPMMMSFGGSPYTPPDGGTVELQFDSTSYTPPLGG